MPRLSKKARLKRDIEMAATYVLLCHGYASDDESSDDDHSNGIARFLATAHQTLDEERFPSGRPLYRSTDRATDRFLTDLFEGDENNPAPLIDEEFRHNK